MKISPHTFFRKNISIRWRNMCFNNAILDLTKPKFPPKRRFLNAAPRGGLRSTRVVVRSNAPRPLFLKHARWRKTEPAQWWRNAKHDDMAMGHGDVMIFFFRAGTFFPSQAAVLFVSNPRGAVPSPAARAHRTAVPRPPSPAADGELWLPPGGWE